MNTQKQVRITDLKGKFTKDFDAFGKMDPFLEFTVGKSFGKTEIASGAGKQPLWKDAVDLTYFDETQIVIKAYDDDATEKQYIGTGKLQIKSLRFPGGNIQLSILSDNGQNLGTISAKYTIKNLPATPLLLVKNLRLELNTQQKTILKSKPFIQFSTEQNSTVTDPKEQVKGLSIAWNQNLRIRIKQSSKITISLIDKDNKEDYIIKYECFAKQFRLQNGVKKFNVFNKQFEKFAVLHFEYDTINLVSKEESVKNLQKQKKNENQLTAIAIERISNELKTDGKDLYFKLIVGTNSYTSQLLKKNQKNFVVQVKKTLHAQDKQNRLSLVFFDKKLITDEIVGYGHMSLESLYNGEKKINLFNYKNEDIGISTLTLSHKTSPCKIINIQNLILNLMEGGDMIGQSEPFIVAKIGNCIGQTQTAQSNKATFKKGIELKYVDEEYLIIEIWDQDATNSQLLYSQQTKLSELKNKGQHQITYKVQKNGKTDIKAKLSFKYELKINVPEQSAKKPIEKKIVETQNPKKQVISPVDPAVTLNPVQAQKTKMETKKYQEAQQKPIKKEQPAPVIQKQLLNQEIKPVPVIQNIKTQQIQTEKSKEPNIKNEEPLAKRDQSIKNSLKQQSIYKSRESLVLPSIIATNKFFGDKIFDKQSAATLQKSILAYSMPKAMRFSNQPKYSGQPSYCMDSCFRPNPNKGVGFGFGGKRQFPQWMERNMKENPPPGAYFEDKNGQTLKGPTFGLSHKYYQKVIIPKEQKSNTSGQTVRKLSPIRDPAK